MEKVRVCVMGSFVVDLMMRTPRLPAAGETVRGSIFKIGPGGKGSNQGVAAQRAGAGAEVSMITKIGNDEFAGIALRSFSGEGLSTEFVLRHDEAATGAALIMVDEATGQNKIVVTPGACDTISEADIERVRGRITGADIFLTQLETNFSAIEHAMRLAHAGGVPIILNPAPAAPLTDELYAMVDYLTPNETEAAFLCGFSVDTDEDLERAGAFFLGKGVKNVIFTLGGRGAFLYNRSGKKLFPPFRVEVLDTTGAGDAFNGGLALALAEKKPVAEAIVFANAVASLKVTRLGTAPAMPYRQEVNEFIEKEGRRHEHA
jgi:ribokinase